MGNEQDGSGGHHKPDQGGEQGGKSPRSGRPPPEGTRWRKGQSGNPKGRPKGRGLTDALRRKMRDVHNGKPMPDILAEVVIKHALSGKFPYLKEIFDRLEGKPVETVRANFKVDTRHFVVPPPRVLRESEDEYTARIALERAAAEHRRMLEGTGDEGAG